MLSKTTFRQRLLGLVAVPTVALVAITALAVRPKLSDARGAGEDSTVIDAMVATTQLLVTFGEERDEAVRIDTTASDTGALAAVRERTDAAAALFLSRVARLPERGNGPVRSNAVYLTKGIAAMRSRVDAVSSTPEDGWRTYNSVSDSVLSFYREITVASHNATQVRTGSTLANLVETKERWARSRGVMMLAFSDKQFGPSRFSEFVALERQGEQSLASFSAAADADTASNVQVGLLNKAREADGMVRTTIDAGNKSQLPALDPLLWFTATSRRITALTDQASPLFDRLRLTAANQKTAADQSALLFGLAGLAAILAALGLSLLIGRKLAERLKRMSSEAESIASDRLPEVLAMLRSPSAEALAASLPRVDPGNLDEIGVIAESFNTVLRTAVATSIQHSHQRSKTLTDMLVNLGRRNQSLIDRQLELIDRMESTQKDADVLEQLFKLDHMVTRMRRNAENLLVLASDKVVRPWSTPVTVAEILQAATSETADLTRVRLELSATDARSIPGRMAVDLSHLVAELVENALTYSPPSTTVVVRTDSPEGDLRIWVRDNGVGMSDGEIDSVNARIAAPPEIDEMTTDQIGFQVVGRLARRMGVAVWLQPNGSNGIAASMVVPAALITDVPSGGRAAAAENPNPPEPSRQYASTAERMNGDRPPAERTTSSFQAPNQIRNLGPAPDVAPVLVEAARPTPRPGPAATGSAPVQSLPQRGGTSLPTRQAQAQPQIAAEQPTRVPAPAPAPARPPAPTSAPASVPAAVTPSGLTRRQPGALPTTPAAAVAAAAGSFQRLPNPGTPAPTRAAPAPAPAQVPEAPVLAPLTATTTNGLARRQPSAPSTPGAAAAAEAGEFRRLPVPGAPKPEEDETALSRSRLLRDLRAGVRRGADDASQSDQLADQLD